MKIKNSQKTHFLKRTKCGLYQVEYDTIENVNFLINNILDNGHKIMLDKQAYQTSRKKLI